MNCPECTEVEIPFAAGQRQRTLLIRTPRRLCPRPALLLNLAADRATNLTVEPYHMVPCIFLAAGHRVAAIDLPYHGDLALPGAEGLTGIAQALRRGEDVFGEFRAAGQAALDACISRGLAMPGLTFVSGTSRGGFAALHLLAYDTRIAAAAAFCPVTHLPVLTEFADQATNPLVVAANAEALIPRLADRPVFLAMGAEDPRVSAERCFSFHARLAAVSRCCPPVLFCGGGVSHGNTYPQEAGYEAGAAFLLRQWAEQMKRP